MPWNREGIAKRIASDIQDGWIINIGIGIPTMVPAFLSDKTVLIHSENGILGMGPAPAPGQEDPDLTDAGKKPTSILPGGAFMDSLTSFGLIRGGHLDLSVMGAYQVSATGDLANWKIPGSRIAAVGGAADLAVGSQRVWVAMEHTTRDGTSKVVADCTYPLTAKTAVSRLFTDLAVLDVKQGGLHVVELAPEVSLDELQAATDADLEIGVVAPQT